MRLKWSEDFETGIKDIDFQHQELFTRVSGFLETCDLGRGKEEIDSILKYLEEYAQIHFATEERLQAQHAYPHWPSHKAAHEEFLTAFAEIKKKFAQQGPSYNLASLLYDLMINWFINHIASEDKALCQFLKTKNLAQA